MVSMPRRSIFYSSSSPSSPSPLQPISLAITDYEFYRGLPFTPTTTPYSRKMTGRAFECCPRASRGTTPSTSVASELDSNRCSISQVGRQVLGEVKWNGLASSVDWFLVGWLLMLIIYAWLSEIFDFKSTYYHNNYGCYFLSFIIIIVNIISKSWHPVDPHYYSYLFHIYLFYINNLFHRQIYPAHWAVTGWPLSTRTNDYSKTRVTVSHWHLHSCRLWPTRSLPTWRHLAATGRPSRRVITRALFLDFHSGISLPGFPRAPVQWRRYDAHLHFRDNSNTSISLSHLSIHTFIHSSIHPFIYPLIQKVRELMESLEKEAHLMLIFTSNISRVSIYERSRGTRMPVLVFRAELAPSCVEEVSPFI